MKLFDQIVNKDDVRGIIREIERQEREYVYELFEQDTQYDSHGRLRIFSNIEEKFQQGDDYASVQRSS